MSVKVATNRLIVSSLNRHAGFYQQLINNVSGFQELGNRLVSQAEMMLAFRQFHKLEEPALMLSNLPIREYQLIGQFYLGWCAYVKGGNPQSVFEKVAEYSTTYKATAFIALANLEALKSDYEAELGYYKQAILVTNNPTSFVEAVRGITVVKAKERYKQSALRELQSIAPLVRYAGHKAYYDYLNSLAVELGQAGLKGEARNICKLVLASPLAIAYPEWQATAEDLRGSSRSFTAISSSPVRVGKVLSMPTPERGQALMLDQPARVLNYMEWKNKMVKKSNGDHKDKKSSQGKTEKELFFELTEIISKRQFDSEQLYKLIDFADKISSKPDPEPDKD